MIGGRCNTLIETGNTPQQRELVNNILKFPYARYTSYFVASTPKAKGQTQQGFAQYYNEYGARFCGLCFHPNAV